MTRRQLYKTIIFGAILLVGLGLLNYLLIVGVRHSENAQTGKISVLMSHRIDPEVIIFGASNGETGVNPFILQNELQMSVFNMSLDGTNIAQYGDLVNEYNDYSKNNKVVVFALGAFALAKSSLPASLNRYYAWVDNQYISQNPLLDSMPEIMKLKYVPAYGFVLYNHSFYKSSLDGWSRIINHPRYESCYKMLGWQRVDLKWGENNALGELNEMYTNVDSTAYKQFQEVVNKLNAKGRKVVIVLMPSQKDALAMYRGYDVYIKSLKQLAGDKNVFLDYSHASLSDEKYFYNYTHLNAEGAEAFTLKLSQDLKGYIK